MNLTEHSLLSIHVTFFSNTRNVLPRQVNHNCHDYWSIYMVPRVSVTHLPTNNSDKWFHLSTLFRVTLWKCPYGTEYYTCRIKVLSRNVFPDHYTDRNQIAALVAPFHVSEQPFPAVAFDKAVPLDGAVPFHDEVVQVGHCTDRSQCHVLAEQVAVLPVSLSSPCLLHLCSTFSSSWLLLIWGKCWCLRRQQRNLTWRWNQRTKRNNIARVVASSLDPSLSWRKPETLSVQGHLKYRDDIETIASPAWKWRLTHV